MIGSDNGSSRNGTPLVAVLCDVPLVSEAVAGSLRTIAEVRAFPAGGGGTDGLLRSLRPDAIVVDTQEEAEAATRFASEVGVPLIQVSLHDQSLRLLQHGRWEELGDEASPEGIRNVLVGGLFGREVAR